MTTLFPFSRSWPPCRSVRQGVRVLLTPLVEAGVILLRDVDTGREYLLSGILERNRFASRPFAERLPRQLLRHSTTSIVSAIVSESSSQ